MKGNANPRPARSSSGEAGASIRLRSILPYLRRVQRLSNGQYLACCPAHNDSEPSLSLREENGKLLWFCHSGCSQEAVGEALRRLAGRPAPSRTPREPEPRDSEEPAGLTVAQYCEAKRLDPALLQQWGVRDTELRGKPAIAISYTDEQGNLKAVRYRIALSGDRFRWRQGDSPRLLGLNRLAEWQSEPELFLCEGETDGFTLWTCGLPALAVPGAQAWRAEWWRILEPFPRITILPHNDEAGKRLVADLLTFCPLGLQERVYVATLHENFKDANELWLHLNADAEQFREAIQGLPRTPLSEWREGEREPEDEPLLVPLGELLQRETPELEYIPLLGVDLLARGTATLFSAYPKAGKSTLIAFACRDWIRAGLRVAVLTEEPALVWKLRAEKLPELQQVAISTSTLATPERWVEELERFSPDVAILDTLRAFGNIQDEADPAEVGRALAPFVELTRRNPRMAVIICHHMRKSADSREPSLQDVAGAHSFSASVDAILLLTESDSHQRRRILHPVAGRLWNNREPLVLELSEDGLEYRCVGIAEEVEPQSKVAQWREQVLRAVSALGRASAEAVHEYLKQEGKSYSARWVRDTLAALHGEGALKREGSGRRGEPFIYYLPEKGTDESDCGTLEVSLINRVPEFQKREEAGEEEPERLWNSGTLLIRDTSRVPEFPNPSEPSPLHAEGSGAEPSLSHAEPLQPLAPANGEPNSPRANHLRYLEEILAYRAKRGEAHLSHLIRDVWYAAEQLDFPPLDYKPAHRVVGAPSGYGSFLRLQPESEIQLLLQCLLDAARERTA